MKQHDTPEKSYDLERLIFFSDGVFAIAITLLAIELHPPEHWDGQLISFLRALGAKLIFYFISFIAIGLYWMAHRFVFRYVRTFSEIASFLNLLFLCLICLTPFANSLVSEYGLNLSVFSVYFGLMVALSVLLALLWGYVALVANLTDSRISLGFKLLSLARICLSPLIMGGLGLWLGLHYGILPSVAFIVIAAVLSSRIRLKPFRDEAPEASE